MALPITRTSLKRKLIVSTTVINTCILCNELCSENRSGFPADQWNSLKNTALKWKGLDKFGSVYDDVNWDNGSDGLFFHKVPCQLDFKSSRKLDQAKNRHAKKSFDREVMPSECTTQIEEGNDAPGSSKRLTRSHIPVIHDKQLCVWCMKPDNVKNTNDLFRKMELDAAWNRF